MGRSLEVRVAEGHCCVGRPEVLSPNSRFVAARIPRVCPPFANSTHRQVTSHSCCWSCFANHSFGVRIASTELAPDAQGVQVSLAYSLGLPALFCPFY